jgi:hypothetical protein
MRKKKKFKELEKSILEWSRNEENDPYWCNVNRLTEESKKKSKFKEVRISFLEFCAPLFNEVLEKLVKRIMTEFL